MGTIRPLFVAGLVFAAFVLPQRAFPTNVDRSGLVETPTATNEALLVGAPNGLPGIDHDMANAKAIATNRNYCFEATSLFDSTATKDALLQGLTTLSQKAGQDGTLLFYFSGHGNQGIIAATNLEIVSIDEMRQAMQAGRQGMGPLKRLVMLFDSCNSGSLLDPVKDLMRLDLRTDSAAFADAVVDGLMPASRDSDYWSKLFVFASSTADEESAGDDSGGFFTVALRKAFDEVVFQNGTVDDFVSKTKGYTDQVQHPVARLVPESLGQEKMTDAGAQ